MICGLNWLKKAEKKKQREKNESSVPFLCKDLKK
jgi:hypothetical protein